LIRIGIAVELVGIVLVAIPFASYWFAVVGFVVIGTGMGPIYPAIQHMAPANFGKKYSASAIGMQMASAYVGSTFMPMVFGLLQESVGIQVMPYYVLICAVLCLTFLEITYRVIRKPVNPSSNPQ
jgi:fucose permease